MLLAHELVLDRHLALPAGERQFESIRVLLLVIDHLVRLERLVIVWSSLDHLRRLIHRESVAVLLDELNKGVVNGAGDFLLEAVKSDEVLDKHPKVVAFPHNDVATSVGTDDD